MTTRDGEYAARGDYHRHLDRRWAYYPVYIEKMRRVRAFLQGVRRTSRILDVGCGEGLLVEEYRQLGYDMTGVDLNYSSAAVVRGDITQLAFPGASYDVVLALDVIEHLNFHDQERALAEIHRVLKPGGVFLATIPNLAHFSSRWAFLLTGRFLRTSSIDRHPGDRPYGEYRHLLSKLFRIERVRGLFPTFPISSLLTLAFPAAMLSWHRVLNAVAAWPSWCFLTLFWCRKNDP